MSIEANNFMILVEAQAEKYGLAATFKETSIVTADGETEAAKETAKEEAAERDAVKVGLNTKESGAAAAAAVEGSDLTSAFSCLGLSQDITEEILAKWDGLVLPRHRLGPRHQCFESDLSPHPIIRLIFS